MSKQIYAVSAIHEDRDHLLGYVTGDQADIKAFYADRDVYGLSIRPIVVKTIPSGFAACRERLVKERADYNQKIQAINVKLESGEVE